MVYKENQQDNIVGRETHIVKIRSKLTPSLFHYLLQSSGTIHLESSKQIL